MYSEAGASSRLAIFQFLPFFAEAGYEITVKPFISTGVYKLFAEFSAVKSSWSLLKVLASVARRLPMRYLHVIQAWKYDVVVVQKDVLPLGLARLLSWGQKRIVYEFDDPIWLPHPGAGNRTNFLSPLVTWYRKRCLIRCLRLSRLCIVDSPKLREFAEQYCPDSFVLATAIDLAAYPVPPHDGKELAFGWIGSPSTTHLLAELVPWLEKLSERFSFCLYNIGSAPLSSTRFTIHNIDWSPENELTYLPRFTIGLMPSDATLFNTYRFSRKWLIYATAHVPTLATNVGLNQVAIREGDNGVLFELGDREDFLRKAEALLTSEAYRMKIGRRAYELAQRVHDLPIVGRQFVGFVDGVFGSPIRSSADPIRTQSPARRVGS